MGRQIIHRYGDKKSLWWLLGYLVRWAVQDTNKQPLKIHEADMKPGDLVKWTFAKTSPTYNPDNKFYIGILLTPEDCPVGSWTILLQDGSRVHDDPKEIELIKECK